MVVLTRILEYAKHLPRKYLRKGILDSLRIRVKGGTGGCGLPRYGGIGGAGGNVYVSARKNLTLELVSHKTKEKNLYATSGGESTSRGIIGVSGEDLTINVPVGISVYTDDGVKLGEVNKDGATLLVAKGGLGGCQSTGYSGLKGELRYITLDLKLIADVGLVGFPNAGKSTFLHALSKAKPKIASYPFTTIRPQIGVISYKDYRTISVADLPGLIEGAHANIGMGHKFLKHVERTKLLLFIVDVQGFKLSVKHGLRSCLETVVSLNKEIELYNPDLLDRPSMIIINKMDTDNAINIYKEIEPKLANLSNFISECAEDIQPEKVIQFDDIISASLALKKKDEITMIKEKIRNIIDKHEQENSMLQERDVEKQLVDKLKQQVSRQAPVLV